MMVIKIEGQPSCTGVRWPLIDLSGRAASVFMCDRCSAVCKACCCLEPLSIVHHSVHVALVSSSYISIRYRLTTPWMYVFLDLVSYIDYDISLPFWWSGDVALGDSFVLSTTSCSANRVPLRFALVSFHIYVYIYENISCGTLIMRCDACRDGQHVRLPPVPLSTLVALRWTINTFWQCDSPLGVFRPLGDVRFVRFVSGLSRWPPGETRDKRCIPFFLCHALLYSITFWEKSGSVV